MAKTGIEKVKGETPDGEKYTELRVVGKRGRIVVQSTTPRGKKAHWFVYLVFPGANGKVRTLASYAEYERALNFAYGYAQAYDAQRR